jgi:hypothetical protein
MYSLLFLDKYFLRNRGRTVDYSLQISNIRYINFKKYIRISKKCSVSANQYIIPFTDIKI